MGYKKLLLGLASLLLVFLLAAFVGNEASSPIENADTESVTHENMDKKCRRI